MLTVRNYYEFMGVAHTATKAELKARYRALSKSYHPDAGGSEQQMAQLNEIYRVLSNPLERATYDRQLAREHEAAKAAAARRSQAAQKTHAQTNAKHAAARAYAEQHDDIFEDVQPTKPAKKSAFWRFMAWSTGAYVVIGLAIMYVLTMPTTASPDTAPATPSSTSLANEAANASANVPDTPSTVTQSLPSSNDSTTSTNATPTETSPTADDSANTQNCDNANETACEQPPTNTEESTKHPNWRRLLHL